MRKPNAIKHMFLYGLVYGWLLAMLYFWAFLLFSGESGTVDFGAIFGSLYFSFIFGGLPGAVMGFFEGLLLWGITRKFSRPLDDDLFQRYTLKAYALAGLLTASGMSLIVQLLFGSGAFLYWFLLLPIFISGGAAIYATRRYMLKLSAWGMVSDKPKNKAKEDRLLDSDAADNSRAAWLFQIEAEAEQDHLR